MKSFFSYTMLVAGFLMLAPSVYSESRIWTDNDGKTIEAEYVTTVSDKVVLRKADGSEIRISLDTLSEKDRRFAILQAPPRIEIEVSTDTDRENESLGGIRGRGVQIQKESIQAEVTIRKTSPAPYEAPLRAELYLIGRPEQHDASVIISRSVEKFKITKENKYEHAFSSGSISLRQIEAGQQAGIEYKGYLAVVFDRKGDILEVKSSKLDFTKNAEAIIGSERGTVFDETFTKVDKEVVKEKVDEKKKQLQRRFPGRGF